MVGDGFDPRELLCRMRNVTLRGLGPRVAQFLRSRYVNDRAKLLARDFNVSASTTQRWLDGTAPTTAHLEEMVARWGRPFVMAIFLEEASKPGNGQLEQLLRAKQAVREDIVRTAPPLQAASRLDEAGVKAPVDWSPAKIQYSARRPATRGELLESLLRSIPEDLGAQASTPDEGSLGRLLRWLRGT